MAIETNANDSAPGFTGTHLAGSIAALGLALAAVALLRPPDVRRRPVDDRRAGWRAYLRDHLTGSDAAITVVERLKDAYPDTSEAALFRSLHREFGEERAVVRAMLAELGGAPLSLKRLAGKAAGEVLSVGAGGARGDLSLFRTLEGLAVGVQGKRLMWRAAQALGSPLTTHPANFAALEEQAARQWEAIERCRLALVPQTFAV